MSTASLAAAHATQPAALCWQIDVDPAWRAVVISRAGFDESAITPHDWRDRFAMYLRDLPHLGIVGAKRIRADRQLVSMGEFIIHPKGCHSLGHGLSADAFRFPEEVDAIAAGLVAVERDLWNAVGGLDHSLGELALLDLSLRIRKIGRRCLCVPDVIVEDPATLPNQSAHDAEFARRWGFDRRSPDLDVVRQRYAGTGLLWNPRWWGAALPFEKYDQRPALHWKSYAEVEPFRQRADHLVKIICSLTPTGPAVDLGCGDGLYAHLLAKQGVEVIGLDPEASAIDQAHQATAAQTYPGARPRFERISAGPLPLADAAAQTLFMLDVIEHLPNPTAVLREAARIIKPGGHLIVSTPAWQFGGCSDPTYHVTEYTMAELERQIEAVTVMRIANRAQITGIYRDIIAIARK
ncbi:MAG: methyltransferase domain-containing protein [Phycisphaerales bacterium]|nr:methyltransferase domain-containing protein [Phycisphaerales bacterium]